MVLRSKKSQTCNQEPWRSSRTSRWKNRNKPWISRFNSNRRPSPRTSIRDNRIHKKSRHQSLGPNRRQSRNRHQHRSFSGPSRPHNVLMSHRRNRRKPPIRHSQRDRNPSKTRSNFKKSHNNLRIFSNNNPNISKPTTIIHVSMRSRPRGPSMQSIPKTKSRHREHDQTSIPW